MVKLGEGLGSGTSVVNEWSKTIRSYSPKAMTQKPDMLHIWVLWALRLPLTTCSER